MMNLLDRSTAGGPSQSGPLLSEAVPIGHRKTSRQAGQPWRHTMDDRQGVMHSGPVFEEGRIRKVSRKGCPGPEALFRGDHASRRSTGNTNTQGHDWLRTGWFSASTINPNPGYVSGFRKTKQSPASHGGHHSVVKAQRLTQLTSANAATYSLHHSWTEWAGNETWGSRCGVGIPRY